jgi:hypothetical protein
MAASALAEIIGQDNTGSPGSATETKREHTNVADSFRLPADPEQRRLLRPPDPVALRQLLVLTRLTVLSGPAMDQAIAEGVLDPPAARKILSLIAGPPADAAELAAVREELQRREIIVNWLMIELEVMLQRAGDQDIINLKAENELRHRLVRQLVEPLAPSFKPATPGKANRSLTSPGLSDHHDLDDKTPSHDNPQPELADLDHRHPPSRVPVSPSDRHLHVSTKRPRDLGAESPSAQSAPAPRRRCARRRSPRSPLMR